MVVMFCRRSTRTKNKPTTNPATDWAGEEPKESQSDW